MFTIGSTQVSIDQILVVALVLSIASGFLQGALKMVRPIISFCLAKMFANTVADMLYHNFIYSFVRNSVLKKTGLVVQYESLVDTPIETIAQYLSYGIALFLCYIFISFLTGIVISIISKTIILGLVNSFGGAILGIVSWMLVISIFYYIFSCITPFSEIARTIIDYCNYHSHIVPYLKPLSELIVGTISYSEEMVTLLKTLLSKGV